MPAEQDKQMDQGPVGQGNYIAREGQCMESIALKRGFFWETLSNNPNNAEIRTKLGIGNLFIGSNMRDARRG